jgi:hypothetical protein
MVRQDLVPRSHTCRCPRDLALRRILVGLLAATAFILILPLVLMSVDVAYAWGVRGLEMAGCWMAERVAHAWPAEPAAASAPRHWEWPGHRNWSTEWHLTGGAPDFRPILGLGPVARPFHVDVLVGAEALRPPFVPFLAFVIHCAICTGALIVLVRRGVPASACPHALRIRTIVRSVVRSAPLLLAWAAAGVLASAFWLALSNPALARTTAAGTTVWPIVDHRPWPTAAPLVGGVLAYVLALLSSIRRSVSTNIHSVGAATGPSAESGRADPQRAPARRSHDDRLAPRCVRCGYEASADRPCPECGLENPLALRRVYFGRWHARLMLSRWRWVAALPWAAVVILFFWPLISGLARHWLG